MVDMSVWWLGCWRWGVGAPCPVLGITALVSWSRLASAGGTMVPVATRSRTWQHNTASSTGNTASSTGNTQATETPAWDTGHPGQPLVASRHPVHQPRHAGEGHLPGSEQFKVQASHSFPFPFIVSSWHGVMEIIEGLLETMSEVLL